MFWYNSNLKLVGRYMAIEIFNILNQLIFNGSFKYFEIVSLMWLAFKICLAIYTAETCMN